MATDDQSPKSEAGQEAVDDIKAEATTKINLVLGNSEPIREDQVQNAIRFLSHPKVSGSLVIYRRLFLEKKGLTKDEINEAFHRIPNSPPPTSTTQPVGTNQATSPPQPPAGTPVTKVGWIFSPSPNRLLRVVFTVGFLAVSWAGLAVVFKILTVPRFKSWIRKFVVEDEKGERSEKKIGSRPSLAEEAAAAAKSAAAAACEVARASQEMLISKSEEKRYFGELMTLLDMQVRELKSVTNSIKRLEDKVVEERVLVTNSMIMTMLQRGENPRNITELNDPDLNQPVSNPHLAPRPKPLEQKQPLPNIDESDSSSINERAPAQHKWVPSRQPRVSMAESASAVRQPKKPSIAKEALTVEENELVARSFQHNKIHNLTKGLSI